MDSKLICLIVGLCLFTESTLSLKCVPCTKRKIETCPIPVCSYGTYKEVCECCDTCAHGPGEVCGGPWHTLGKCGDGLTCLPIPGAKVGDLDTFPGIDISEGRCHNETAASE